MGVGGGRGRASLTVAEDGLPAPFAAIVAGFVGSCGEVELDDPVGEPVAVPDSTRPAFLASPWS